MYTIYNHTNTITSKSYIGITKYTMEYRWQQHITAMKYRLNKGIRTVKFYNALNKYPLDTWTHEILETNVPKELVEAREIYWISELDTFNKGYNSTKGGMAFNGFIPKKGDEHHATNTSIYTFYRRTGSSVTCTISELCETFSLKRASVRSLIAGRQLLLFGWAITPLALYPKTLKTSAPSIKPSSLKPCKVPRPKAKRKKPIPFCSCGNTKAITAKVCRKCYADSVKGEGNPLFGTTRPQHVKIAVSKRMRDSADQIRRTWIHPEHGIEQNITSLELRDKYNLNISHLKKITDRKPKYKSHKGWTLYVENSK